MKIAIGCDHGGYLLKQDILIWLEEHDIDFEDVGCYNTDSVDYPVYGEKVARLVASGECDKGIVICTTGIGIECNTNRGNDPLPDADILRFYRQMGGEIITLGSDAHEVKDVGCVIKERQELLKDCGFRYFTTFTGGEPAFQKL